jgi:hypothetical protein
LARLAIVAGKDIGYVLGEVVRQAETARLVARHLIYAYHISVRKDFGVMAAGCAVIDAAQEHAR